MNESQNQYTQIKKLIDKNKTRLAISDILDKIMNTVKDIINRKEPDADENDG